MPPSPLISIIIPVYNVEKYLRKCLDSICGQTYRNLEILCINDGSTDGSGAILDEYAGRDERIKVFNQKNAGLSAARNTGLEHAKGVWITGVDSDDYLAEDAYEYALSKSHDDVDIICFGTQVVWEQGTPDEGFQQYFELPYEGHGPVSLDLIQQINVTFWNKLWRKQLIDRFQQRFPVGLCHEDNYFWFTLAPFARSIAFAPERKIYYLQRFGSIMSEIKSNEDKMLDRLRVVEAVQIFHQEHPLPEPMQKAELIAFENSFYAGMAANPVQFRQSFWSKAQHIATKYGLIRQYRQRLRFLSPIPWWLRPFVRHKISKSYYGLPGLPIITIVRYENKELFRLFGLKIKQKFYSA